jgi:hypothetical protein
MTQAYPLQWPMSRPRTKSPTRAAFGKTVRTSRESLTVADALGRLQGEIDRLGARNYVISSNVQLRLDGLPRSGQPEPTDRGVALYFTLSGKPHCLPCDRYDRVADNIAAIAKHIEATRAIERYGVASIAEMFTGFTALPSNEAQHWSEVLGVSRTATADEINTAWRHRAKQAHSDTGGSDAAMSRLNVARDAALKERSES